MKEKLKAVLVLTLVALVCASLMYFVYTYYGGKI